MKTQNVTSETKRLALYSSAVLVCLTVTFASCKKEALVNPRMETADVNSADVSAADMSKINTYNASFLQSNEINSSDRHDLTTAELKRCYLADAVGCLGGPESGGAATLIMYADLKWGQWFSVYHGPNPTPDPNNGFNNWGIMHNSNCNIAFTIPNLFTTSGFNAAAFYPAQKADILARGGFYTAVNYPSLTSYLNTVNFITSAERGSTTSVGLLTNFYNAGKVSLQVFNVVKQYCSYMDINGQSMSAAAVSQYTHGFLLTINSLTITQASKNSISEFLATANYSYTFWAGAL